LEKELEDSISTYVMHSYDMFAVLYNIGEFIILLHMSLCQLNSMNLKFCNQM